jgi:hypothetical protein
MPEQQQWLAFYQRLGDSWGHLADVLEIPPGDQRRFPYGDEGRAIHHWLSDRNRLDQLSAALESVDRADLVPLVAGAGWPAGPGAVTDLLTPSSGPDDADRKGPAESRDGARSPAVDRFRNMVKTRRDRFIGAISAMVLIAAAGFLVAEHPWSNAPSTPLTVDAQYEWYPEDGVTFVLDRVLTPEESRRIQGVEGQQEARRVAEDLGAVQVGSLFEGPNPSAQFARVQIAIELNQSDAVTIVGIRANILSCRSPLGGTLLWAPSQGELEVTNIAFDLDSEDPIALKPQPGGGPSSEPYRSEHYLVITSSQPVILSIDAYTEARYCEWEVELDLLGKEEPILVRLPNGEPFRTTAFAAAPYLDTYVWDHENGKFTPPTKDAPFPWEPPER